MWKGGRVGPGRCCPPQAFWREGVSKKAMTFWREGVSKKAMTFVFCVLICMRFRILHSWQTCNMAWNSHGQVDMSARSSTRTCLSIFIYGETNKQFRAGVKNGCGKTSKIKEKALSWNQRQANQNAYYSKTF